MKSENDTPEQSKSGPTLAQEPSPADGTGWTDRQLVQVQANLARKHRTEPLPSVGQSVSALGTKLSQLSQSIHWKKCECGDTHDERLFEGDKCFRCVRKANEAVWAKARLESESGIEPRFADLQTWDDLLNEISASEPKYQPTLQRFRGFLNNRTGSVLAMVGQRGPGKTQMASVGVRLAIDRGLPARIIRTADLLKDLKGRFGTQGGEEDWVNEWCAPWLLVLDEFAERVDNDWNATELTGLIDRRYATMKKTVVIANLTAQEFAKLAGKSIVDRANEQGGILVFDWTSFRAKLSENS